MTLRFRLAAGIPLLVAGLAGCTPADRVNLAARTGGNAALFGQFQAYDGRTGRPLDFAELVRRAGGADVVFWGEEHSDAVCNQLEAQLFYALARSPRPLALAMEFFEADTQGTLDAYLRGRIDEEAFRQLARQGRAYVLAHRPLIELCREAGIPVLAANAPRRLVREYRRSGLAYPDFRAELDPGERRWVPRTSEPLEGPYRERFFEIMGGHGGVTPASRPASQPASAPASQPAGDPASRPATMPASQPAGAPASRPAGGMGSGFSVESFFKAQLMWDDAMAESLADFRARFPARRVMLVVGVFHVAHEGGTVAKFRLRRPQDRVLTVAYRSTPDGTFPFEEEDLGAADVVVYGIEPPPEPEKERPAGPPTTAPASQPASQPSTRPAVATTTAPTSAPAETQPAGQTEGRLLE